MLTARLSIARRLARLVIRKPLVSSLSTGFAPPVDVTLNYQTPPPAGKTTGRYINQDAKDDVVDEITPAVVKMRDARAINASLETHGFCLVDAPSQCEDFADKEKVKERYDAKNGATKRCE